MIPAKRRLVPLLQPALEAAEGIPALQNAIADAEVLSGTIIVMNGGNGVDGDYHAEGPLVNGAPAFRKIAQVPPPCPPEAGP